MRLKSGEHCSLPGALLDLCRATALGLPWTGVETRSAPEWELLTRLADHHGLVSLLHTQSSRHGLSFAPAGFPELWREHHRAQVVRELCGIHQVRQFAAACADEGIELVFLKGAAVLLWLYEDRGMRIIGDLDVLVRAEKAARAAGVLERLGYRPISKAELRRSAEERYLAEQRRLHMPQMARGQELPIELHLRLFRRKDGTPFLPDVWSDAFTPDSGSPELRVLSPAHTLLHGCIHYCKHLRQGFCPLKGLMDLLLIVQRHGDELDWREIWAAARHWGIRPEVATVLATIARVWLLDIPGIPSDITPFSEAELIFGRAPAPETETWRVSWRYLSQVRHLEGLPSRARYLLRALFPEPPYLRAHLNLAPGSPLIGAYFRYSCSTIFRAAMRLRLASPLHRPPRLPWTRGSPRDRGAL